MGYILYDTFFTMKISVSLRRILSSEFLDKLDRDKIFDLSASLSYYTALSLAPLLILLITFVSFLGADFKAELVTQVQDLVGTQASETIKAIAMNAHKTPEIRDLAGIIGVITLLFSAGAIFSQLRRSLNTIFEVDTLAANMEMSFLQSSMDFLKQKIFSMGMVLTFVFISLVSLVVSSFISMTLHGSAALIVQTVNLLVSLLIFSFLFASIYFFLPQKRIPPVVAITAGVITAFLFSIGKTLIGLYLGQSAFASLYGAAGSFIVLLMWVYYSSIIIFISAEIANEINKTH